MSSTIRIAPERVLAILSIIIVALSVLHLATQFAAQTYEGLRGAGLISRIFDMDEEVSLPTWFSQSILLAVAVLAFAIGRVRRSQELKDTAPWFGLSGIFLYMSIDEGSSIHESGAILQDALDLKGTWLHHAWVLGGVAVVLVVAFIFFRFWLRLPTRTR